MKQKRDEIMLIGCLIQVPALSLLPSEHFGKYWRAHNGMPGKLKPREIERNDAPLHRVTYRNARHALIFDLARCKALLNIPEYCKAQID